MTTYTAKTLTAALAERGYPLHYSTVLHGLCPLLLEVGAAEKPGRDYAVTDEGLAALVKYLEGREYFEVENVPHNLHWWKTVHNLYDPDQIARVEARYTRQD